MITDNGAALVQLQRRIADLKVQAATAEARRTDLCQSAAQVLGLNVVTPEQFEPVLTSRKANLAAEIEALTTEYQREFAALGEQVAALEGGFR